MKRFLEYERTRLTRDDPREWVVITLAVTALIGFTVATMIGVLFYS